MSTNNTFDIRRIQNYCKENGRNIDSELYSNYFLFDDDGNIYKWEFEFTQPTLEDLRKTYPDEQIIREIALIQIRSYRNKFLRNTDGLLVADRLESSEEISEIRRFRRLLRDLPNNIDPSTLRLNNSNRINIRRFFNKRTLPIKDNIRPIIKEIIDSTDI